MTDKVIKNMLQNFDVDTLDMVEKKIYNTHRASLPKVQALYTIVKYGNDLSDGLNEIKEFIEDYEITIKF